MKAILSAIVALSVLAGVSASANATFKPADTKKVFKEIESRSQV